MDPYFTFAELAALIPDGWLTQSLDDDDSGAADAFDAVLDSAETAVNSPLSLRYATPVAVTPFVKRTALLIGAETCYKRRGMKDQFPYQQELDANRKVLEKIAAGEMQLAPEVAPVNPSGAAVVEDARTQSDRLAI